MTLIVSKLHLIKVKRRTVALIPAGDPLKAIIKYVERTGFDYIYEYLCNYLTASTIEIDTTSWDHISEYYSITASTKTISGNHLSIDSYKVTNCSDLFNMVDPEDVNDWLFIRPTIKEARNCVGFRDIPEYELRKFCI